MKSGRDSGIRMVFEGERVSVALTYVELMEVKNMQVATNLDGRRKRNKNVERDAPFHFSIKDLYFILFFLLQTFFERPRVHLLV